MKIFNKPILPVFIFLFLSTSCMNRQREKDCLIIDNGNTCNRDIDRLSSVIENYRFIRLETSETSLIGRHIVKIKKHKGQYYILSDRKEILAYDSEGRFVSKINKLGTGPGEYGILADFDISENDELIILDAQKILICDMQGHLKNSIPLHLTGFNIQRLKNERYLVCASGEKYVLYVLDKNGHVLKKELKNKLSTRIGSDVPFVSVSPEKIIFQTGFSNDFVLYDMDENVFSDIRFLCNNECINTREEDRLMEIYGLDYLEKSPDLKILFGMASYKNHLLYKSGNGKKYTIHFTNIIHHAEDRVSSATLDDITYSTTPDLLLDYVHYGNAEDCFISYFYPSQLNIGHHDNEYNDKYRELIRSLTTGTIDLDDENPILFEFTVRNCPPGAAAEVKPDGAKGALIIEDLIAAILTLMIVVRFGKEASLPVSVYD